jgi:hypothetical protein
MWGWLWYQPTTRVGSPVLALTCSASALQAAICSGLVSTRSCRTMKVGGSRQRSSVRECVSLANRKDCHKGCCVAGVCAEEHLRKVVLPH